jgi:hypothetical protein
MANEPTSPEAVLQLSKTEAAMERTSTDATTQEFHNRAKQAGDQLRAYIVSISAAATGMLFLNLTDATRQFTNREKLAAAVAIVMFSTTVLLTLIELHLNARRFFEVARQRDRDDADWTKNEQLKAARRKVMWGSYGTMIIGMVAALAYMVMQIW